MQTNLQGLFGMDEGKSPRQIICEGTYLQNGVDFDPVFDEAYELTMADSTPDIYRGRGFMAYHMNWNLIGLLKQKFPNRMATDQHGRSYYVLDVHTRIYFKKLNSKYAPDNIPTDHVRELNSMSMFYSQDNTTILYAGIKIGEDSIWQEREGCYLVEMRNLMRPNWISDLSELSYIMNRPKTQIPLTTIKLPDEIILKPKRNDADLGDVAEGG